jgi:hypothetical protein
VAAFDACGVPPYHLRPQSFEKAADVRFWQNVIAEYGERRRAEARMGEESGDLLANPEGMG